MLFPTLFCSPPVVALNIMRQKQQPWLEAISLLPPPRELLSKPTALSGTVGAKRKGESGSWIHSSRDTVRTWRLCWWTLVTQQPSSCIKTWDCASCFRNIHWLCGCSCTCSWVLSSTVQLLINLLEWLSLHCVHKDNVPIMLTGKEKSVSQKCCDGMCFLPCATSCLICECLTRWFHQHLQAQPPSLLTCPHICPLLALHAGTRDWVEVSTAFPGDFKPHLFLYYAQHSEIKIFPSETSKKEIKCCI